VIEANDEWAKIEVASGIQLEVLRQAVSRRLDGEPGTSGGTWENRWSSGDSPDGADDTDDDRPEADGHGADGRGADGAGATDGAEATGPTAGDDETSETRAE
jgi:hypothetical protein